MKTEINWRTVIAARYRDDPENVRVGDILRALPDETRLKIAVAFDYKGDLNVAWKRYPTKEDVEIVGKTWENEGCECKENVHHWFLMPIERKDDYNAVWC